MLTNTEKADLIDDAADLMEREGWYNPRIPARGPRYCAVSSLAHVVARKTRAVPLEHNICMEELMKPIYGYLGLDQHADPMLPSWNDAQETIQPVLDAFRSVSKELRRMDDWA